MVSPLRVDSAAMLRFSAGTAQNSAALLLIFVGLSIQPPSIVARSLRWSGRRVEARTRTVLRPQGIRRSFETPSVQPDRASQRRYRIVEETLRRNISEGRLPRG